MQLLSYLLEKKRGTVNLLFITILFALTFQIYAQEGGYGSTISVTQGDTIDFHISTSVSPFNITIYKISDIARYVTSYQNISGGIQSERDSSYWYGCGWKSTYSLIIPESWEPGVYRADFPVSNGGINGILFIVKPKSPGSFSNVLYILSTNTWNAYNNYGGKCLYDNYSTDYKRSYKVSFHRPAALPLGAYGSADFYKYGFKFISWATLNNISMEYAAKYDLDRNPNFLSSGNYKVVFLIGHNEYWSYEERIQLENFIKSGGRVIILSGNTCWWQVRFEDNGKTMVCYKDRNLDPFGNTADSLYTTVNWWKPPVDYPENIFTGVNFKDGGYVNSGDKLPHSSGYGDYAAFNTQYWVFKGTGLKDGDQFGYDDAIVGYETDGTPFFYKNGVPTVLGKEMTPMNYRIFGVSPTVGFDTSFIKYGHATMGMYYSSYGGALFNGATTDWSDGLYTDSSSNNYPDPTVDRITKNVFYKFLEDKFPPEITAWSPYKIENILVNYDPVSISKREVLVATGKFGNI